VLPLWLRIDQVLAYFPFKEYQIYELIKREEIESELVNDGSTKRGLRWVSRESIERWMERKVEEAKTDKWWQPFFRSLTA
jgi:hypothetical protein